MSSAITSSPFITVLKLDRFNPLWRLNVTAISQGHFKSFSKIFPLKSTYSDAFFCLVQHQLAFIFCLLFQAHKQLFAKAFTACWLTGFWGLFKFWWWFSDMTDFPYWFVSWCFNRLVCQVISRLRVPSAPIPANSGWERRPVVIYHDSWKKFVSFVTFPGEVEWESGEQVYSQ